MASKEKRGRRAPKVTPASPDWEESGAYRALRANRGRKARSVTLAQPVTPDPPANPASKAPPASKDPPASSARKDRPVNAALLVMPELAVIAGILARKD